MMRLLRDVFDGGADGRGAVEHDLQLDGRRDGSLQRGEDLQDVVDGADDVGAGSFEDDDEDGGLAVEEAAGVDVFDAVDRRGRRPEAERCRGRWRRRRW